MVLCTCPPNKIQAGQQEEGHGVGHHVQGEHHQTYLLHHYQNASIQDRQIHCRKYQCVEGYGVTVKHCSLDNLKGELKPSPRLDLPY